MAVIEASWRLNRPKVVGYKVVLGVKVYKGVLVYKKRASSLLEMSCATTLVASAFAITASAASLAL